MGDGNGLAALEARFHHAALVILSTLVGVLVAEVDFHPGDPIVELLQRRPPPRC